MSNNVEPYSDRRMDRVSPWTPETNPTTLKRLGKLGEELGELQSAAMRCLIQGIGEASPDTGKPNRQWLLEEMADVEAMTKALKDHIPMSAEECASYVKRFDRKLRAQRLWDAGETVEVTET